MSQGRNQSFRALPYPPHHISDCGGKDLLFLKGLLKDDALRCVPDLFGPEISESTGHGIFVGAFGVPCCVLVYCAALCCP